jgi:hypothetical protein
MLMLLLALVVLLFRSCFAFVSLLSSNVTLAKLSEYYCTALHHFIVGTVRRQQTKWDYLKVKTLHEPILAMLPSGFKCSFNCPKRKVVVGITTLASFVKWPQLGLSRTQGLVSVNAAAWPTAPRLPCTEAHC